MKKSVMIAFSVLIVFCLITGCSNQSVGVPVIKSIEFLDKDDKPLAVTDGWINLQAESTIKVTYEGNATHIDFYTVPTGTEVLLEQKIIGHVYVNKGDSIAKFEWKVPDSFMGNVWILAYNGDVARSSDTDKFFIKAIHEK